ncbi:MMPL family protein [compost metagenome]
MSIVLARLREGDTLSEAYYRALLFTGKVVMLTGVTLAIGVGTWVLSPIKFQADMGILLAFMFVLNMIGALILLPALAYFLLPRHERGQARDFSLVNENLTTDPVRNDASQATHENDASRLAAES